MCDLVVALPDTTATEHVVFGKNSDRPAGECQVLFRDPGGAHAAGEVARCSYRSVPRGKHTRATLGLRPYWCWGYETGLNDSGVVGGNAALFTALPPGVKRGQEPGLTGMDLLRLALERGGSAEECVSSLVALLERYGQWGSAVSGKGHEEGSYDNAFLFADAAEAWVLETAGRSWAAERVTRGTRTISNELSIRERFDRSSEDVAELRRRAEAAGGELDFAYAFEDHDHYARQVSHIRRMRSQGLLSQASVRITVETVMRLLRDHYEGSFLDGPSFNRYLPDFHTLCMHDSPAGFTWGDTASSLVTELSGDGVDPIWVAYLPPCSSAYLPVSFDEPLPPALTAAGTEGVAVAEPSTVAPDSFEAGSLWWRLHRLLKATARRPEVRLPELRAAFDPLEMRWLGESAAGAPKAPVAEHTEALLAAVTSLELRWRLGNDGE